MPVAVQGSGLSDQLLSGTRSFASGLLETVLVLFFLLVSGDTFLVTRGKRLVVLVGQRKALAIAVKGSRARRRWSKLREWLMGCGRPSEMVPIQRV